MPSGRKPQPTMLKVLHGNPHEHRLPSPEAEPQGQGELWAAPTWFDDDQREQWHYAIDFAPPGLLTATDRQMLTVWVGACVEYQRAMVELHKSGQVVKTVDGNVIQNPYLSIINRQALILIRAVSELGFSPAARASLGAKAPEFDRNGGRPTTTRLTAYLARKPDRLDA